jgi:hypothetical protein
VTAGLAGGLATGSLGLSRKPECKIGENTIMSIKI